MTLQTPLFMQAATGDTAVSYSGQNYRLSLIAALCQFTGVIDPIGSGGLLVSQRGAGANMSVDIAAGYAIVPGGDISLQGSYLCISDAVLNVVVPAAPPSGTRVHRVVAQVRDHLSNSGLYAANVYNWVLNLLADTGTGTPALPASAISLALVSVSAAQSSVTGANITDQRAWARWALSNVGTLTVNTGYTASDASRVPQYRITADGFCHLHGFLTSTGSGTATAGTFYQLASGILSAGLPSGNRDGVIMSNKGAVQITVNSSGIIQFTPLVTTNYVAGDWWSFEGFAFKIAN